MIDLDRYFRKKALGQAQIIQAADGGWEISYARFDGDTGVPTDPEYVRIRKSDIVAKRQELQAELALLQAKKTQLDDFLADLTAAGA